MTDIHILDMDTTLTAILTACSSPEKTLKGCEVTVENLEENIGSKESSMLSDDEAPISRTRKRAMRGFSDSSSDEERDNGNKASVDTIDKSSNEDSEGPGRKDSEGRSRIRINSDDSISDEEEHLRVIDLKKKEYFPKRDRKKKLHDKFKKVMSPGGKSSRKLKENVLENDSSDDSSSEVSCLIKQKVKEKTSHIILSVCDPDESDDEENYNITEVRPVKLKSKVKNNQPKQMRMSAKEAMENMQKIKSESNRMLREKEVSLPYHRPKALSLKDIMSRRRPAVSSDGKTLPIKMNEEQLRHYAMLLEQRQKEMMELCKSDTDEEDSEVKEANGENVVSNNERELNTTTPRDAEIVSIDQENEKIPEKDIAYANDVSFNQIANEKLATPDNYQDNTESSTDINIQANDENTISSPDKDNHSKDGIDSVCVESNIARENYSDIRYQTNTEESQLITLHYDSEKPDSAPKDTFDSIEMNDNIEDATNKNTTSSSQENADEFSDTEINYEDIDALIENAEILKDNNEKEQTTTILASKDITKSKPKLTGAPGMIISLDGDDTTVQPSGVELLKERFTYFAKLKQEQDMEKDREKKYKPGTQHIKLKQQLEEEIAEQRSIEWAKRLEEEKLLKSEQNALLGDEDDDDIEKIEKKLEEEKHDEESGTDEDDLVEDDVDMSDKPQKRNPMADDEAEESEDNDVSDIEMAKDEKDEDEGTEETDKFFEDDDNVEDSDTNDESSSESENESEELKPKKGRILKAFEDSDEDEHADSEVDKVNESEVDKNTADEIFNDNKESQDDDLQLAQANKSISEDLFPSQESSSTVVNINRNGDEVTTTSGELGTFSILNTSKNQEIKGDEHSPDQLSVICETQPGDANFDEIAGMCSGSFSQTFVPTQANKSQLSPSQEIGDDMAALCTGQFYDNPFVSQANGPAQINGLEDVLETSTVNDTALPLTASLLPIENEKKSAENAILKSILDELDDPDYDKPKRNKFFPSSDKDELVKKKFVIDSDDETNDGPRTDDNKVKKKRKKRKLEERALQISDDEEEDMPTDDESDVEDDAIERVYEYDSEENEVEVQEKPQKKKRMGDFFENEAELTSEDEWVGSGDEDEAGLDRMEREEGDDEVFHQGKLQRELGQIHMREVLDQDKREVRLIQELLFEDADLGDGHRQRKFRWKNIDGEEETGTVVEGFGDTPEDEFESEEQWRKQRHEREMFLRKMQENDNEEVNTSINRTTIIKANLTSRTMSNLIAEAEQKPVDKEDIIVVPEKKTAKDIPSPKKPFVIFKQNYHGSLLTRGRGALARLAALATPLAGDDDAPKVLASARGNFVFTALGDDESKPQKRKAEASVHTPQLIKKMKTKEVKKTSLFDRLRE